MSFFVFYTNPNINSYRNNKIHKSIQGNVKATNKWEILYFVHLYVYCFSRKHMCLILVSSTIVYRNAAPQHVPHHDLLFKCRVFSILKATRRHIRWIIILFNIYFYYISVRCFKKYYGSENLGTFFFNRNDVGTNNRVRFIFINLRSTIHKTQYRSIKHDTNTAS